MKSTAMILAEFIKRRALRSRKPSKQARIEKHINELSFLKKNGASYNDLVVWLRQIKRMEISKSWIHKIIKNKNTLVQSEIVELTKQTALMSQLREIQAIKAKRRARKFNQSRLDKYAHEIMSLYNKGVQPYELRMWLKEKKRVNMPTKQIKRRIKHWKQG